MGTALWVMKLIGLSVTLLFGWLISDEAIKMITRFKLIGRTHSHPTCARYLSRKGKMNANV